MSLSDYARFHDEFQLGDGRFMGQFSFPCCCCMYAVLQCGDEPCNMCGHNYTSKIHQEAAQCKSDA